MSNEKINNQIALLHEQIENFEKSGHFTEREMDSKTHLLRQEIEFLKSMRNTYGMTSQSYDEGIIFHKQYFSQIPSPALMNTWNTLGRNLAISKG